jgi:uncharacterized Ntn-hydrolase superfamily protein
MKQSIGFFFLFFQLSCFLGQAQDTFSIVAMDTVTGEVGSAGASCVDLFQTNFIDDSFLGELFPAKGAINSQAYYLRSNQVNAQEKLIAGLKAADIINWLETNDTEGKSSFRQYGIVTLINGKVTTAAFTGDSTDDYKGHLTGVNYSIQGNILADKNVLEAMETAFINTRGDLSCKLMAALQGANTVGADRRCSANKSSSLFAFIKVAQKDDIFGEPSFSLSVRTHAGEFIEPIDSLQILFDNQYLSCPE